MRSPKFLSAFLAVACLAGAVAAGAPRVADASPHLPNYYAVTIPTQHWNMCSTEFEDCGSHGGVAARDLVVWFRALKSAWTISLNEMCEADIQDIVNRTGLPGHMAAARNNASKCTGAEHDYGNGVIRSGSLAGTASAFRFTVQDVLPCDPNVRECRIALCVPMNSYAGVLNSCSTHLENEGNYAYDQAAQYIYWVTATFSSGGKFLAGDFNLTPGQVPTVFYDLYFRAPQAFTWKANNRTKQIDYIWHDRAHSAANLLQSPHCDNYYSDHCYTFSKIQ